MALIIEMKKATDGTSSLRCVRVDGTDTWQHHQGAQGRFFPLHDLTHFAVESTLELGDSFYGLVDRGWNVTDFGEPWPRGPMPTEAAVTERMVGLLDTERATGHLWVAAELNGEIARGENLPVVPTSLVLTDERLGQIRSCRRDLFQRWQAIPPGETLRLKFPPDRGSP